MNKQTYIAIFKKRKRLHSKYGLFKGDSILISILKRLKLERSDYFDHEIFYRGKYESQGLI